MSFARGDLARRAALADNLAVPEPWSSNDDPRVFAAIRDLRNEFRQLGITDADGKGRLPDFLLDYENLPPIKPTTLDRAHARNSSATRWDQNGNLVEDSSDTLRLQRDPKTQEPLGLLYEPKRTQLFSSPQDITNTNDWAVRDGSTNGNVGAAKGQNFDEFVENTNSAEDHGVEQSITSSDGTPVATSAIVKKPSGSARKWCFLTIDFEDTSRTRAWFDLVNGSTGQSINNGPTTIENAIHDLGGGWYRVKLVVKPSSTNQAILSGVRLADTNGGEKYDGDGSSNLYVLHQQIEESREVTTPILTGSATRGADAVNYGFIFPDKTTGVACSIEQQTGNDPDFSAFMRFGDTLLPNNQQHGILMDDRGLNANPGDGFKTLTRNSDDTDSEGVAPTDQTITNFQVDLDQGAKSKTRRPVRTVRQIAIHTTPHTQKQKDTLRDQYLTQP